MKIEDEIKQPQFKSIHQKAIINLIYTNNWFHRNQKHIFTQFDITPQQFNLLRILRGRYPVALNPKEIKEVMIDKTPDITRLVDRLLIKEFVTREVCEENRKMMDIKITDKGCEILDEIDPFIWEQIEKLEKVLTTNEANELNRLLDKFRDM